MHLLFAGTRSRANGIDKQPVQSAAKLCQRCVDLLVTDPIYGSEQSPLILPGLAMAIDEHGLVFPPCVPLEGKGDEIPESPFGQGILVREQPIERGEREGIALE
jgi:hypothetical protein